jgi:hypothetical protein
MSVPSTWFERKQTPRIPNQTVYVSSDGSTHFPDDMATDHIVNALNKLMREKQTAYRMAALGIVITDREQARYYLALADDRELVRMELLVEKPVIREMEEVVARRQEALNGTSD